MSGLAAPSTLLTEWARLLFVSLADAGITDVVISPGSRNTPFVVAAVREPRLRCHEAIDERAAAFFALGQARVTGRPSVVLCTSGSAGAHYYPGVIEASMARVPLLVVTADRPIELQGCEAPQTIDQVKLFGGYTRWFVDLGMPDPAPLSLRAVRRAAAQAAWMCVHPTPGPVQINARARKPLEPAVAASPADHELAARVTALTKKAIHLAAPGVAPSPEDVARAAARLASVRRGVIVCGPAALQQAEARTAVHALARRLGFPLFTEAASQLRYGTPADVPSLDRMELLLATRTFAAGFAPELVIQLGAPPTSGKLDRMLAARDDIERWVVAPHAWNDPHSNAAELVFADVGAWALAVDSALQNAEADDARHARQDWTRHMTMASDLARRAVDAELAARGEELSGGEVARSVVAAAPPDSLLMIGNSLPIRELDLYASRETRETPLHVLSQRGANGIDGLLAGAAGAAAASSCAVTLLVGDVSFLYDLTSALLIPRRSAPFVVVVMQNRGGRIFEHLPLAALPGLEPEVLRYVMTPHSVDFEVAARFFGLEFRRVSSPAALAGALATAYQTNAPFLVEAVIPEQGSLAQQRRTISALEEALADWQAGAS